MGVSIRLAQADIDAMQRYAEARGTTANAVVRAALRAVGVTDPSRAGTVTLDVNRDIGRRRKAPTASDATADRRALIARVVAERGPPVGKGGILALADELGINWRTLYRDLAVLRGGRADGDE